MKEFTREITTFSLLITVAALAATPYQVIDVADGGTIKGVVKQAGDVIEDELKEVTKNSTQCGASITAEKYVVSAAGEVRWAVAMLDGIAAGRGVDKSMEIIIDNQDCRFDPHVLVAPKGGNLQVKNSDPMLHNSHFYLMTDAGKKKNVINLALPNKDQVIAKRKILRKPGLLSLVCDAHDFMQGYIWCLPHPYAAVTDETGQFELTGVPPGDHKLKIWHEALGEQTVDVTVAAGETATVEIELTNAAGE
jgi:hypothetical protein